MKLDIFKAVVPLLVVLLTAAVSGLLVPGITRHWQDYEKELQLKAGLVDGINEAVMSILLAVQFAEHGSISQEKLDDAYQKWEVQRAMLSGKLKAYFADTQIADKFDRLTEEIGEVYALSGTTDTQFRFERIDRLKSYFGAQITDWNLVADLKKHETEFLAWYAAWWKLRTEIVSRKDALVRELLTARGGFFSRAGCRWPLAGLRDHV
jgi:hypothetical protein